jgi:hypothetical protein
MATNINNKTAECFIREMDAALDIGDWQSAQEISIEAARHYPDNREIYRYAYILAPSKVTVSPSDPEKRKNIQASRQWMRKNWQKYRGNWVAVKAGELLATAKSFDELVVQLENTQGTLLTVIH